METGLKAAEREFYNSVSASTERFITASLRDDPDLAKASADYRAGWAAGVREAGAMVAALLINHKWGR